MKPEGVDGWIPPIPHFSTNKNEDKMQKVNLSGKTHIKDLSLNLNCKFKISSLSFY